MTILRIFIFILMLPLFGSSFFILSMTGSYLGLESDWKERMVFTPEGATDPQQIYLIDKLIYAFPFHPLIGIGCMVSSLILIGMIIYWIVRIFVIKKIKTNV